MNLHYEDTVETDVYLALRERIGLFETVVGRLQPILAELPRSISSEVLAGHDGAKEVATPGPGLVERIREQVEQVEGAGFDLGAALDDDLALPTPASPPVTMDDLDRVIRTPELMPGNVRVQPLRPREYSLWTPGAKDPVRVTTEPRYYEEHADSMELWSPGNPVFQPPELEAGEEPGNNGEEGHFRTLRALLARMFHRLGREG